MQYSQLTINLLSAFLTLIITLVIGNILHNILRRILRGIELNKILEKDLKLKVQLEQTIANILKYIIYLIGLIAILNQLGISTQVIWTIFLVLLAIILIFTSLSLKDVVPNIFAGIYINKTKKIRIGETIKVKGVEGQVIAIKLLETKIETKNKEVIFIPNSVLTKEEVIKL